MDYIVLHANNTHTYHVSVQTMSRSFGILLIGETATRQQSAVCGDVLPATIIATVAPELRAFYLGYASCHQMIQQLTSCDACHNSVQKHYHKCYCCRCQCCCCCVLQSSNEVKVYKKEWCSWYTSTVYSMSHSARCIFCKTLQV